MRRQARETRLLDGWRLELEITGRCGLTCAHCYADSGPSGGHGTMTVEDWIGVITDAEAAGVSAIQFIGGEPTMYPHFGRLLRAAIDAGLAVEVFSNMVRVREEWWDLYESPMVSLATSYYSDQAAEHDAVTGRLNSHARTRANIAEAVKRGIPIRAGIIDVLDGQRVEQARAELHALGVDRVGTDRLRGVGRGARTRPEVSQLCGGCGRGMAAISPDGDVWPCVLSRWMRAGNVKEQPLAEILTGRTWESLVAGIPGTPLGAGGSEPQECKPEANTCNPTKGDGADCPPSEKPACDPKFCQPELKRHPR